MNTNGPQIMEHPGPVTPVILKPELRWTDKLPTVEGFYWNESAGEWPVRLMDCGGELFVYTKADGVKMLTAKAFPGKWLGPVAVPPIRADSPPASP